MTQWHQKSAKLATGALRTSRRRSDKRLAWKGSEPTNTVTAEKDERLVSPAVGSMQKVKLRKAHTVSLHDKATNKTSKVEVTKVVENHANRLFTRRNIVTKGAVVEVKVGTEIKQAKVTNRPGQTGVIHAELLTETKEAK